MLYNFDIKSQLHRILNNTTLEKSMRSTDGTLKGPNLPEMEKMAQSVKMEVIASGGVSCLEDLVALRKTGVQGAIVGKAIYTDRLDLKKAIEEIERVN